MASLLPPIPNEPIGENFQWREWFNRVRSITINPAIAIFHNLLGGLQGGAVNDYQHLTLVQVQKMKSNQVLTWLTM